MEPGNAMVETILNSGISPATNSPPYSECLESASELLEVLKTEAQLIGRFAAQELLALVPKKEYLVSEFAWRLESARQAGDFAASDSFKAILSEINTLNASNGFFIEKSLSVWQGLLSIFLPTAYGPTGKSARRPASSPQGSFIQSRGLADGRTHPYTQYC